MDGGREGRAGGVHHECVGQGRDHVHVKLRLVQGFQEICVNNKDEELKTMDNMNNEVVG